LRIFPVVTEKPDAPAIIAPNAREKPVAMISIATGRVNRLPLILSDYSAAFISDSNYEH
jgi:hypothetical protein